MPVSEYFIYLFTHSTPSYWQVVARHAGTSGGSRLTVLGDNGFGWRGHWTGTTTGLLLWTIIYSISVYMKLHKMHMCLKKRSFFIFLCLLGQLSIDYNNIWYCCSWENLQTNDILPYNIYLVCLSILQNRRTRKYSVCFQCFCFVWPSCQFSAAFSKVCSAQSSTFIQKFFVKLMLLHNL